jgi:hypothetical protein
MGFTVYWCSRWNGDIEYIETTAYGLLMESIMYHAWIRMPLSREPFFLRMAIWLRGLERWYLVLGGVAVGRGSFALISSTAGQER